MGLTIRPRGGSYDFAVRPSWSYSGFNRFRRRICDLAGLGNLEDREWFGGSVSWPTPDDEPLVPLLAHSDCDGDIGPEFLPALAARLEGLLPGLSDGLADQYDHDQAVKLIASCREAAAAGVHLDFC